MGYKVPLGQRIESVQIAKANVAKGFPGRALLLGPDCLIGKATYYDDRVKRSVEVTQEDIIKYHFDKVTENYYMAIARLNTDMSGNIVSNDFKIEYLRLSGDKYGDFCTQLRENPNFTSLLLEKVEQSGPQGQDYSWTKVSLSSYPIDPALVAKVQQVIETPSAVDSIMQMLDSQTSITIADYEKRLAELEKQQTTSASPAQIPQGAPMPAPHPVAPAPMPRPLGAAPRQIPNAPAPTAVQQPAPAVIKPKEPAKSAAPAPATMQAPDNAFDSILGDSAGMQDSEFESGDFEMQDEF